MECFILNRKRIILIAIMLLAFALRVVYLTHDRFHADEALYAGWALRILDDDPLLLDEPVDKPPLFLYTLAGAFRLFGPSEVAARWVNLACSMIGIALIYRLYLIFFLPTNGGEIWTAFFLACSPFDVLFARTAFTDPMLNMWWLASLLAAAHNRFFLSGLFGGLAFATKQNALLLIPMVLAVGVLRVFKTNRRAFAGLLVAWGAGLGLIWGLITWWDSARWTIRPGYWDQSVLSYGGLAWTPISKWPARLLDWLSWARYLVGGWAVGTAFVVGVIGLLVTRQTRRIWHVLWTAFMVGYVGLHVVLNFSLWDRYLLPLAAPIALLGAQIIRLEHVPGGSGQVKRIICTLAIPIALMVGGRAAFNGYPVGGEHWAYQGIDRIAIYLKANAAPNAVLYHHWLRWHYTYYLHGTDLELRWWRDGAHLRQEASRTDPAREQYIVLPDWRPLDPAIEGIRFEPILQTERLTLYKVIVEWSRQTSTNPTRPQCIFAINDDRHIMVYPYHLSTSTRHPGCMTKVV